MRIAVHASHTINGAGCPGCVAIKNEAIESRVIVDKMIQVASTYDDVEIIDCSVDFADSYVDYIDESAKRINESNPDFVISIGFSSSLHHTPSMRSDIYLKSQSTNDDGTAIYNSAASKLAKYMQLAGFIPSLDNASRFALTDKVDCKSMMIFDVCSIDTAKAMKLYENTPVFEYIILAITSQDPHYGWYTPNGIDIKYIPKEYRELYKEDKIPYDNLFAVGIREIDGHSYLFDDNGFLQHGGLTELGPMKWVYSDFYTGRLAKSEWVAYNMNVYYADDDCFLILPSADSMNELPTKIIDEVEYTFDKTGCVQNELHRLNGTCKVSFFRAEDGTVHPYIAPVEAVDSVYDPIKRS